MYPLRERHDGLLVRLLAAIHVHQRLSRLRRKHVRAAHSQSVGRRCALLEDMALGGQRLVFVHEYASVFGDARVGLGRRRNRRDKMLGEHCGRLWNARLSPCCPGQVGSHHCMSDNFLVVRLRTDRFSG